MDWNEILDERDEAGLLTPTALAMDAIQDAGWSSDLECGGRPSTCPCEGGACLPCLCAHAIRGLWEALQQERAVMDAATELTSWDWEHLLIDHPDARVVMDEVKKIEKALLERRG